MKHAVAVTALIFAAGCTTDPFTGEQRMSNTAGGAAIGAGLGALAGLAVGGSDRAQRNAVLIGAGVGALGGGAIGNYMDRQENELRQQLQGTGVSVTRQGDQIVLNMPSNVTFDTDQDQVRGEFYNTLNSVALVLRRYEQTVVDVNGHTDSTGNPAYNQALSERRALSVANYLNAQGIDGRRFAVNGFGDRQPVTTNATPEGRQQNRRVEIYLAPIT
ncbi:OmpA family protein [Aliihoeflea sp. 40Bstr573]|uniref:OmpA family protein n=1 Tax=Aliihoeflea sp. 40Bstr573 TaxID=2696467 RepID=UPI002095F59D|nr:OmpA family protein [Aliihoeflea sp. 40Bstr573]MCO6385588.1 OmpA family protein [Aliihoeflea sp. 40Bstr573]